MLKFATPKTTIYPKRKEKINPGQRPSDYVLGATGEEWEVLLEDGKWRNFAPIHELQVMIDGDLVYDVYGCVGFSLNSDHEFIHKRRYGVEINKSDRFLVVGSGTKPYVGNTVVGVAEWDRLNGWVSESSYPFTKGIKLEEYYKTLMVELLKEGKNNLRVTEARYKWLGDNRPTTILQGLKYSPIQVSVEPYKYENNLIINSGNGYTHEVLIFDYEEGKEWWVFDSESNQFLKFAWNYNFGWPMIHSFKRTSMLPKIYKQIGSPALYALNEEDGVLVPFSDGVIAGGKLFKTLYGISSYADLPRVKTSTGTDWQILPYPIATYSFLTK